MELEINRQIRVAAAIMQTQYGSAVVERRVKRQRSLFTFWSTFLPSPVLKKSGS